MRASKRGRKAVKLILGPNLKKYTSSEVASTNAYTKLLENASSWRGWIEDTLEELLEVPSGRRLEITQASEIRGEQIQKFTFEQKEISIGRAPENDIPLSQRSVSRRHARIVEREDGLYVEDLGSSSGTYVNRQRLEPAHGRLLANEDEVLIFPYVFRLYSQGLWTRDKEVEFSYSCRSSPSAASEFVGKLDVDLCVFQLRIHPEMGHAILALGRPFLKLILSRLTRQTPSEFTEMDSGLFEFIVVSILSRANQELRFPFQCLLVPSDRFALQDEKGITLEASMRLSRAKGSISLFLPDTCLRKLKGVAPVGLPGSIKEAMTWKLQIRTGFVDLGASDLDDVELGDTLLYTPDVTLILPAMRRSCVSEQGWHAVRDDKELRRFEVKEFFERGVHMDDKANLQDETERIQVADLKSLPIRIHVVLSEVELSLKDLEGLSEGSIIELDEEHRGTVQLVTNGRTLGGGELVEIEDKLGVQITRWRNT
jgi:type III secretion system YscQ/HrcQ family protein